MPLKIKNMKNIDYFSCASPASTAICSSRDQTSMIKNTTTKSSINRFNSLNPYSSSSPKAPCISELPFTPRLSSSFREKAHKKPSPSPSPSTSIVKLSDLTPRRKSSADVTDIRRRYVPLRTHSSRYLLSDSKNNININQDDSLAIVVTTPLYEEDNNNNKSFGSFLIDEKEKKKKINKTLTGVNHDYYYGDKRVIKSSNYVEDGQKNKQSSMGYSRNDSLILKKSSSSGARSRDQVVVLRVSLHCKGCEGKLRKHLSKMEGVTSFSIDLETKKVTVIGKVTPLEVLTSISKVKNAQFWPSATSPSSSSSSSATSTSSSTLDFN